MRSEWPLAIRSAKRSAEESEGAGRPASSRESDGAKRKKKSKVSKSVVQRRLGKAKRGKNKGAPTRVGKKRR